MELSTGDYELEVEVRCNGELVRVQRTPVHVSPLVVLSQWVPRECWVMHPTSSDAVDCGGIVVDQTGAAVPDAAIGSWSQPFSTVDGGWGRWVVTDAGVHREADGERTPPVAFPEAWFLATDTFAYTTGRVAVLQDGGLISYAFDAGAELDGSDFAPCAASGSSVAWCEIPFLITGTINPFARWVVCEIAPDDGSVRNCTRGNGAFVRQDLRTQRVTFQGTERFIQVDLGQPERVLAERALRVEEWLGVSNHGSGPFQLRRCNERCAFLFPDPSLETFVVDRVERWYPSATSEFVWRVEDGGTRYSRLRALPESALDLNARSRQVATHG